jgi:hypothetical protein
MTRPWHLEPELPGSDHQAEIPQFKSSKEPRAPADSTLVAYITPARLRSKRSSGPWRVRSRWVRIDVRSSPSDAGLAWPVRPSKRLALEPSPFACSRLRL